MIEDQINKDYIQAMKDRNAVKSSTLSFLKAQLKNMHIERRATNPGLQAIADADTIAVIKKQVKQRQDSIDQFEKGGRQDLALKEAAELEILKGYLPQEMSREELESIVTDAVKEVKAGSMKDMGRVMAIVAGKTQGRADNKLVSEIVKHALAGA